MILASVAADTARKRILDHETDELTRIDIGIRRQINDGKFRFCYDGIISPEARHELERCGYTVTTYQYQREWVEIKWG